jgi:hypothetical protein
MVALSDRKIEIVRTLVEAAPDKIVGGLQRALAETGGDTVLASVRQLVEVEARDRLLRNAVFHPVAALFVGDGSDTRRLVFPARALACIWRGLKTFAPAEMTAAADAAAAIVKAGTKEQRPPDASKAFDAVVATAAQALRDSDMREFRTAIELCDRARAGGGETLLACLEISPVVRRTLGRLPEWVSRGGEDTGAAARIAYKDAVAIAEDAGPRFFEMLAAQVNPPWMVLRIISAIMDKPTERYLADSELGGFPERVMDEIDASLKSISKLDLDAGPEAARVAGALVELITQQHFELEGCIELTRDHGWGHRIMGQKKSLASVVEGRLRDSEKVISAALPTISTGFGRSRRSGPRLDTAPDPQAAVRAVTLLTFAHQIRHCANYGGFAAMHTKVMEKLWDVVDHYAEDVLADVRNGDAPDLAIAHAHLRVAADIAALVHDEKAGELVRRRAATACSAVENTVVIDA